MKRVKRTAPLTALVLSLLLTCAGCTDTGGQTSSGTTATTVSAGPISVTYSSEDLDDSWDSASATAISLTGESATVTGKGATVSGSTVTITAAGTYVLSGILEDGQIIVAVTKNDTVHLVLHGVEISCSTSAAIDSQKAKKTIVTLAEGTTNILSDGGSYTYPDASTDEPDACLFAKDDLTINGKGSLQVTGNYQSGIGTKDNLVITGGTIKVTAVKDALRGRDSVAICGGTFDLKADNDGIKSNNDEDTAKGWISLDGGTFTITAGCDGVQAETVLQVSAGDFTIATGGGSANASTDADGNAEPSWGQWGGGQGGPGGDMPNGAGGQDGAIPSRPDGQGTRGEATTGTQMAMYFTETAATTAEGNTSDSAKGIKAGTGLYITGGSFSIDSSDDSIHCNGVVTIAGGELTLSSGDDGVHADAALTIDDGTIDIAKCYEGLEGLSVTVNGGNITLTARDDGVNAAGGNDSSSVNGRPGQNDFSANGDIFIRITGGTLVVDASGDGLDSNGALYITGGTVTVNGPTSSADGALDYDGTCEVTGGILVAAGSSGMAQAPGTSSSQASLMVTFSSIQQAGTTLRLTDTAGNTVVEYTAAKAVQNVVISAPQLKEGEGYTLYSGEDELCTVTLSGSVTSVSDSGQSVSTGGMGGMPGGQGQGGMQPPTRSIK